jgi:ankyrin repeat protein
MKNKYENDLFEAAKNDDLKGVKTALLRGARVNVRDRWGETPLIYAAQGTSIEVVSLLLEKEAKIDCKGEDNWTPLFYAVDRKRTEIAKLLVDREANINAKDTRGKSVFYLAVSSRNLEIIDYLIDRGVDMNTITRGNRTPLMVAIAHPSNFELTKRLVDAGADLNLLPLDIFGNALIYSTNGEGAKTLKFLLKSGLMYFDTDIKGRSIFDSLKNPINPQDDFSEAIEFLEGWRKDLIKPKNDA